MNIAGSLFALSQFENIKKAERRQELEEFYDNLEDTEKKKEEKPAKKKNTNCIGEKQNEIRKKIRKVEKPDV